MHASHRGCSISLLVLVTGLEVGAGGTLES